MLWRMLYETALRATAVLELNVEDCDFETSRAKVTAKGARLGEYRVVRQGCLKRTSAANAAD